MLELAALVLAQVSSMAPTPPPHAPLEAIEVAGRYLVPESPMPASLQVTGNEAFVISLVLGLRPRPHRGALEGDTIARLAGEGGSGVG